MKTEHFFIIITICIPPKFNLIIWTFRGYKFWEVLKPFMTKCFFFLSLCRQWFQRCTSSQFSIHDCCLGAIETLFSIQLCDAFKTVAHASIGLHNIYLRPCKLIAHKLQNSFFCINVVLNMDFKIFDKFYIFIFVNLSAL